MNTPAFERFIDDELMRAPLLAEQVIEEALNGIRQGASAMTPRERSLVADVQRALGQHRPLVVREFSRSLRELIGQAISGGDSTRSPPPTGLGGLSLVDESQVEEDVEISRVIEAIKVVADAELRELMSYASALVGDMDVARDYNPFSPETMARALWSAAQALPLQRPWQLSFMRHACQPMAQLVRKSYAGACARLAAQGVEPAVYRTIIVFGSRRARGQQDAFFDATANRAETTTPLPGAGGRPTTTLPAAPAPRPGGPRPSLEQLLARTDELLRALPADSHGAHREQVRSEQRQQLVDSAEQAGERELIVFVGRLFDTILGDRRLDPDIQNLLSRLQPPVLRLALRDAAVLDNPKHPAWLLMDRMAVQGDLHPPPGAPERTRMLRFMHGVLDTLVQEQAGDADVFRWARERVVAYERSRFEQRRAASEAELHSLQALEDQAVAGGPPPTSPGALDVGQLDTVPAELLDDLMAAGPAEDHPTDAAQWLQARRSGEWVHVFMQGAWVNAQLLWYGTHREYWLYADGASATTWAVRRRAIERLLELQLLAPLQPRSLIRDASERVLREMGQAPAG